MSEYESLREDIATVADSLARYSEAVGRAAGTHDLEIRKLWADNAALRDELHALANRVETLTRARLTEPAETASKMVDYDRPVRDLRGDVLPGRTDHSLGLCSHGALYGYCSYGCVGVPITEPHS